VSLHTAEAILLDVRDLHDRDRIVEFLTRERGRLSGVAKGSRTKHSRFAGQLQPLARVRITWFEKEGRELVRVSDVALLRPAARLQADLEGILLGSYLVEHVLVFAQENEPADLFFRLLDSTLEALLAGADRDLAARYFETWVLRLAGVFPVPTECPACGRPFGGESLGAGGEAPVEPDEEAPREAVLPPSGEGLVCIECAGGDPGPPPAAPPGSLPAGPDVLGFLRRTGRESLVRLAAKRPPEARTLRRVEELAARVRRTFLQTELKSYRVLRRTLGEPPGTRPGGGTRASEDTERLEGRRDPS
jgi:recombinational DNA repair protein (RecF pathway)